LDATFQTLFDLVTKDPHPRFSFLGDEVVYGDAPLRQFQDWDWSRRLSEISVQRLEFNATVTREELEAFLDELIARLSFQPINTAEARPTRPSGVRYGTIGIEGEKAVLRLLDKAAFEKSVTNLGFTGYERNIFMEWIKKPYGMILVTGPTGSGKTTTLYASLAKINTPDRKIVTVEDPVEYQLRGVNQIHIKPQIGLTFANGLRSIVRQDPDIIMVGEIRDPETAEIAIQAALTGHLVFSTVHTNDAAGAITRLQDMGIESFLIASALLGILAQRLVRVICTDCKAGYELDPAVKAELGLPQDRIVKAYRGQGCPHCNSTGYRGRMGIYELLMIDDAVREKILSKASAPIIREQGRQNGMHLLRDDGLRKVVRGQTTVEEIMRVTQVEQM
ncbi:MAG: GspE/PulE family protein, partial [Nitrospinaceae bacterium]